MANLLIKNLYFHIFGPVNIEVEASECIGVTGPSGAGKTLFLRSVADLDQHRGSMSIGGIESTGMPAPEWRKKAGLLLSESSWWFDLVGDHFVNMNETWLEKLGFDISVLGWEVSRLSTGERQRLALLRLLSNRPDVLLLDEPTANLDAENSKNIEMFIADYRCENKAAVIWVSHDMDQLNRAASRCYKFNSDGLETIWK